jgi:hypothetical protein
MARTPGRLGSGSQSSPLSLRDVATAPLSLLAHDAQQLRRANPDALHDRGQDLNVLVDYVLEVGGAAEPRGSHGSRDGALRGSA